MEKVKMKSPFGGNQDILRDIADWTSREFYKPFSDTAIKIKKRLHKKHKIKVDTQFLTEKIKMYKEIYETAKKNLPKYTITSNSCSANPQHIKSDKLSEFLSKKFPMEDKKIVDVIVGWVIEWEYLR